MLKGFPAKEIEHLRLPVPLIVELMKRGEEPARIALKNWVATEDSVPVRLRKKVERQKAVIKDFLLTGDLESKEVCPLKPIQILEAEKDNPHSQFEIAIRYLFGIQAETSLQKALAIFQKLNKYAEAKFRLGYYHLTEAFDLDKAAEYFLGAVNNNDIESNYYLAHCFFLGQGQVKDFAKAFLHYQGAATKGDHRAAFHWAFCFWHGYGIAQDKERAKGILRIIAEAGFKNYNFLLHNLKSSFELKGPLKGQLKDFQHMYHHAYLSKNKTPSDTMNSNPAELFDAAKLVNESGSGLAEKKTPSFATQVFPASSPEQKPAPNNGNRIETQPKFKEGWKFFYGAEKTVQNIPKAIEAFTSIYALDSDAKFYLAFYYLKCEATREDLCEEIREERELLGAALLRGLIQNNYNPDESWPTISPPIPEKHNKKLIQGRFLPFLPLYKRLKKMGVNEHQSVVSVLQELEAESQKSKIKKSKIEEKHDQQTEAAAISVLPPVSNPSQKNSAEQKRPKKPKKKKGYAPDVAGRGDYSTSEEKKPEIKESAELKRILRLAQIVEHIQEWDQKDEDKFVEGLREILTKEIPAPVKQQVIKRHTADLQGKLKELFKTVSTLQFYQILIVTESLNLLVPKLDEIQWLEKKYVNSFIEKSFKEINLGAKTSYENFAVILLACIACKWLSQKGCSYENVKEEIQAELFRYLNATLIAKTLNIQLSSKSAPLLKLFRQSLKKLLAFGVEPEKVEQERPADDISVVPAAEAKDEHESESDLSGDSVASENSSAANEAVDHSDSSVSSPAPSPPMPSSPEPDSPPAPISDVVAEPPIEIKEIGEKNESSPPLPVLAIASLQPQTWSDVHGQIPTQDEKPKPFLQEQKTILPKPSRQIFNATDFGITVENISPLAAKLLFLFQEQKADAEIIGGASLDYLLNYFEKNANNRVPRDTDLTVKDLTRDKIFDFLKTKLLEKDGYVVRKIEATFPIVTVTYKGKNAKGVEAEETIEISPHVTFQERDFSVNMVALRLKKDCTQEKPEFELEDYSERAKYFSPETKSENYLRPFQDIGQRCLRTLIPPYKSFSAQGGDPVRMLRAVYMHCKKGMDLRLIRKAMYQCAQDIFEISPPRLFGELLKLLALKPKELHQALLQLKKIGLFVPLVQKLSSEGFSYTYYREFKFSHPKEMASIIAALNPSTSLDSALATAKAEKYSLTEKLILALQKVNAQELRHRPYYYPAFSLGAGAMMVPSHYRPSQAPVDTPAFLPVTRFNL